MTAFSNLTEATARDAADEVAVSRGAETVRMALSVLRAGLGVDVTATGFPVIPIAKGGTGAVDAAAARVALGLSAGGGGAIDLGVATATSDRLTAVAPSGYSRYSKGTLLLFQISHGQFDPTWTGSLNFYIGTDYYDLYGPGTSGIYYDDLVDDTYYLAVVDTAVQILGPIKAPTSAADGTLQAVVLDAAAGTIVFTSTTGTPITLSIADLATDTELAAYAPLASPVLTGTPTADTAAVGINTTQIATTAFVTVAVANAALASAAGFTLRSAAGAPAQALGDDGDWYINQTTGGFYEKVSGAWELRYTDQVGAGGGLTQSQVDARADARIGVALAAAVTSNTETGIVVTYNSDGTMDFVIQAAAQTHTNFVGIIDGALSAVTATDFTVSGVTAALTIPAYSGSQRLLFARPSSESDPSAVYLYQSGNRNTVNQISIFVKSNTSIQLGGEAHNWWGTVDLQNGAGEYVLEQVN